MPFDLVFQITTLALRCLCWVIKFPLPSLKTYVLDIASHLFKLLKNHARTGGASGDNYEMVLSAFKVCGFTLVQLPN